MKKGHTRRFKCYTCSPSRDSILNSIVKKSHKNQESEAVKKAVADEFLQERALHCVVHGLGRLLDTKVMVYLDDTYRIELQDFRWKLESELEAKYINQHF